MLKRVTYCLALLLALSPAAAAQGRGPSTSEERAKTVRLTRRLEQDPLNDAAMSARTWLLEFVKTVPDLDVVVCSTLVEELLGKEEHYARELAIQPVFSETAFIIEHPEKAGDQQAVLVAGVEGMLRGYESVLKAEPEAHLKFLDDLLARRNRGELAAWVAEESKTKCTAPKRTIR
jgi:carboxypeptidase Q